MGARAWGRPRKQASAPVHMLPKASGSRSEWACSIRNTATQACCPSGNILYGLPLVHAMHKPITCARPPHAQHAPGTRDERPTSMHARTRRARAHAHHAPYDTSTTPMTTACRRWSNMSLWLSSVLKSADPARIRPATLGRSLVMKICVAHSATCAHARPCAGTLATRDAPHARTHRLGVEAACSVVCSACTAAALAAAAAAAAAAGGRRHSSGGAARMRGEVHRPS